MASMKFLTLLLAGALGAFATPGPISKVLKLLGEMEEKTKRQGQEADAAFKEADEFCDRRSDDIRYSIRTTTNEKESLEAKIEKSANKIESVTATLQETAQDIVANEAELSSATEARANEKADFKASEKNLLDTMDSMKRAVGILEKEAAAKKGAAESLLQVQRTPDVLSALEAMVSGSVISADEREELAAFLQNSGSQGQPMSGGVIYILDDLQDKAKGDLQKLREKENQSRNNYQLLRQSLEDEIKSSKDEMAKLKGMLAEESSSKASDENDLKEANTNLAESSREIKEFTVECRRKREDYKLEKKERADELNALVTAKEALIEKTGGIVVRSYSFLQFEEMRHADAGTYPDHKVLQMLRDAARKSDSMAISLLARRVGNLMHESQAADGRDVFANIKTMISNMIFSLEKQLREEAEHAQQCKHDMAVAKEKIEAKTSEISKYQNRIDVAASKSAGLKAEVSELQQALSSLAEAKGNATKIRNKEKTFFTKNEPELEQALEGVKNALKVLRDYYGEQDVGAATGIVAMLETVESDFAKNLAEMRVAESTSAADFKKDLEEMELEKTRKEQDVKYKTGAHQKLDADLAELLNDADSAQSVLDDEKQYAETLKVKCTVTPATFEEKRLKRQQEIDDLQEALAALDSAGSSPAAALVQRRKVSALRQLRGSHAADIVES
eukprot:TRINITY_DN75739_c0_g1_i1.p1 TRINITY_DN75739_c0_g1~~TRINITY_DN75739_c0_g1_i1.p1  ORF type:complete len:678 (+),score=214.36 TRINITY_DN75739_c0_g1_i1:73-2106(+)